MTTFLGHYCPGCGCEVDAAEIGWANFPLNDDMQAWQFLCEDCFAIAYPKEESKP